MKRLGFAVLVLLFIATSAAAAWHPRFDTEGIWLYVGETKEVRVTAYWTGIWVLPFRPWTFMSSEPLVADVRGSVQSPNDLPVYARVTGLRPGDAGIWVAGYGSWREFVNILVVCGREDVVAAAMSEMDATIGRPVELHALTPIAHRTAFTWYRGRSGDTTQPLGLAGPVVQFTPDKSGTHYVWVQATTPCSTSAAEFRIGARMSKQRTVRR